MNPLSIHLTLDQLENLVANQYYLIGIPLVYILNHFLAFKYRTNRLQTTFYCTAMIVFGFIGSHIGADVYNWFQRRKGNETMFVRTVFGTILTVVIVTLLLVMLEKALRRLLSKIKKAPVKDVQLRDVYDAIEPGAMLLIVFTKFRCLYVGCCFGIECSWGVYSKKIDANVFPVQITEAIMSFCILVLVWYLSQKTFFRRGMALFLGGGLFCFGRFFLEFLMYYVPEDRTYPCHLTLLQWACILIFLVCVGAVTFLYKTQPSEPLPGKLLPWLQEKRKQKQTVTQKRLAKGWQSTKKKYKKKKK